jgi:hypothetical protein
VGRSWTGSEVKSRTGGELDGDRQRGEELDRRARWRRGRGRRWTGASSMATGMREEMDRGELDGDGDEVGARRGGQLRTRVCMLLGAALLSRPAAVGLGADPSAVCASALGTCWR